MQLLPFLKTLLSSIFRIMLSDLLLRDDVFPMFLNLL